MLQSHRSSSKQFLVIDSNSIDESSPVMDNVFKTIKPFFILIKISGIFPMSYESTVTNGKFVVKWHDMFVTFWCFSVMILLLIMNIINGEFVVAFSTLLTFAWHVSLIFGLAMLIFMFLYHVTKHKTYGIILNALNSFDQAVSRISIMEHSK